jgi:hypothetical protein
LARRIGIDAVPDFPPDHVYAGEPIDAPYWRYSIRCHVEQEIDKAYYWPKLKEIYAVILPLIGDWQDQRLNSDQALQRMIRKPQPDGSFHATLRNAPVGGLQKLTRANLEKVGSKYLSDNDHLIARFENGGRDHFRFYEPKGRERAHFFLHEIFALRKRLKHDRSVVYQSIPHDFWLRIGGYEHQHAMSRANPLNQAIDLYIWQGVIAPDAADALVRRIGSLTSARHIWKNESGFKGELYTDDLGYLRLRYAAFDQIEDAVDGCNRFGSRWIDLMAQAA